MRAGPPIRLLLAIPLLAATAHAAPIPDPRPQQVPARGASLPSRAVGSAADAAAGAAASRCGAAIELLPERAGEWLARAGLEGLPTPHTRDTAGIAVLEDDGSFFYTNSGGQLHLDIASIARAYARTHADAPDQLALYLASGLDHWLGSPGALAAAWVVRNDIAGIGLGLYDLTAALGMPARLSAILTMNGLHRYPADPDAPIGGPGDTFSTMDVLAHEFGHRWLSYTYLDSAGVVSAALLGRDHQHWGFFFDSERSFMEGCEWSGVAPDSFVTTGVSERFGSLDQYLMGIRSRAEMDSLLKIDDPTALDPPGAYIPTSIPAVGVSCRGRATRWDVADIERVHGARLPASQSGGDTVRVAFVLVTPRGSAATSADLAKLGLIRSRFAGTIAAATGGRLPISLDTEPLAGPIAIAHDPLPDLESMASPRRVAARITVGAGARRHGVDPAGARLRFRAPPEAPEQFVPMTPLPADSFEAWLPPQPSGTTLDYWITATSDSAAAPGWPVPSGASGTHRFSVGPDGTPPSVRVRPMPAQGRTRMPQTLLAHVTDGLGVDSVWAEFRVDGGAPSQAAAQRAGRDSFTVALPGWPAEGARIAYRVVARDGALAGNLGYSNPAWDTLLVIDDWIEDFEHPTPWFTSNVLYSWRSLWHLARRDTMSATEDANVAWHSGVEGAPYPPHVDGALYSPLIPSVPPGSLLRLEHRHDLEQRDAERAWDGARVEASVANGPWQVVLPIGGYSHTQIGSGQPFSAGSPCWSGTSPWRESTLDLTPYAPGPLRLRFRMTADDLVGGEGWWVDRVRIEFPGGAVLAALGGPEEVVALGPAWPHPARAALHQSVQLAAASRLSWSLFDLQGRRVALLAEREMPAGRHTLTAALPAGLASGIHFARLEADGRVVAVGRIAILH